MHKQAVGWLKEILSHTKTDTKRNYTSQQQPKGKEKPELRKTCILGCSLCTSKNMTEENAHLIAIKKSS